MLILSLIDGEQHREDQRLNQAEQQAQHLHHQRSQDRENIVQILRHCFFSVEVSVKTERQRERADNLLNNRQEKQRDRHRSKDPDQVFPEAPLLHPDKMSREERNNRESRRHGKTGRRHMECLQVSGARKQAGVVADDDEDEEGREHREVLFAKPGSQRAVKVVLQASYRHLRDVLQLSRHFLHIARGQPAENSKNKNDGPHCRYGSGNFQWSD